VLAACGTACLGVFFVFFKLGSFRTLTKHEAFVAVASREMAATEDFVVPRFGGLPRLKKPPLMYWSAAAAGELFGRHDAWTARFPAAVSALLLALLVGTWAGQWYGRAAGLAAGLIQISSLYVLDFGRKAEVDMLLCLLTTTALFLVSGVDPDESRKRRFLRWSTVYALAGLSWLAKFHYGPAMIFSVALLWMLDRRNRALLPGLLNPLGLLLFAAAVVIWPLLVLRQLPQAWDVWQAETIGRAVGQLGSQPVWYYVPQVVLQTLPWSPLLFTAMRESFRKAAKTGDRRERFLWLWFCTQFALLTASAFKHHHYLMPALPALTLMTAPVAARLAAELFSGDRRLTTRQTAAAAAVCVAVGIAVPLIIVGKWPSLANAALAAGLCVGIGGCLAVAALRRRRVRAAATISVAASVGCYVVAMGWIIPERDRRLPTVQFASAVKQAGADKPVCVFGLKEHPIVYYLHDRARRVEDPRELSDRLRHSGRLLVVTDREQVPRLAKAGTARIVNTLHVDAGRPHPKGPPLLLIELRRPAEPRRLDPLATGAARVISPLRDDTRRSSTAPETAPSPR
jgi:4-amino-4-deoxy-L-arabinose transferase-like glycosyltransferase